MDSPNTNRRRFVTSISGSIVWIFSAAGLLADDLLSIRKARRHITPLCSVPPADYQHGARSPSVIVRSLPAIDQLALEELGSAMDLITRYSKSIAAIDLSNIDQTQVPLSENFRRADMVLERSLNTQEIMRQAVRPKAKLMQLARRDLAIAHCSLSDIALLIEPCGVWHLSMRGDQNYLLDNRRDPRNDELHIKRNAFNVKFRLLRSSRKGGENLTPTVGGEPSFDQAGKLSYVEVVVPEFWVQREAPQVITRTGHHPMIANHFDDIDQTEFEFFIRLDALTGSGEGVNPISQPSR